MATVARVSAKLLVHSKTMGNLNIKPACPEVCVTSFVALRWGLTVQSCAQALVVLHIEASTNALQVSIACGVNIINSMPTCDRSSHL